jgi:HTH-type transcriptional regulator / antitoxin HigA
MPTQFKNKKLSMQSTATYQVIKNQTDYKKAVARLEAISDAPLGTAEGEEANILADLIDKYEEIHFPIGLPNPVEAIKVRMEDLGLKNKDLAKIIGYHSRVSEILNGKRKLTLDMIRKIHVAFHIPLEVLVQEY